VDNSDSANSESIRLEIVAQTDTEIDNQFTQPFQNGYAIIYIIDDDFDDNDSLCLDEYAFIDETGAILGGKVFCYAFPFEKDGRALVQLRDLSWAYIDQTGEVVAPGEERQKWDHPFYQEGDLLGLTDEQGNHLTGAIYTYADGFNYGLCYVRFAEGTHKNAFIDKTGSVKSVLPDDWQNAQYAGDGMVFFGTGDNNGLKFRLYNLSGELLNSTYFDMAGNFEDGLAPVVIDNKLGLIDTQGNIVVEPYLAVETFYLGGLSVGENLIVVGTEQEGKLMIVKIIR